MGNVITGVKATEKQIDFIRDLIAKRDIDDAVASECIEAVELGELTKKQAGAYIDAFLAAPKRAAVTRSPFQELLASIPKSRYAITTDELELTDADDDFRGDLAFFELKEYMGTLYMRQLHGAPGSFNRSKLTARSVRAIVALISSNPYGYAKLFGEHYTCCGSCGAELTDERSRALMLGPECRKKFGL